MKKLNGIIFLVISFLLILMPFVISAAADLNSILGYAVTAKQGGAEGIGQQLFMTAITQDENGKQISKVMGYVQSGNYWGFAKDIALEQYCKGNEANCQQLTQVSSYYDTITSYASNPTGAAFNAALGAAQSQNPGFAKAMQTYQMLQQAKVLAGSGASQQNVE